MEPDKDKPAPPEPRPKREPSIHTGHRQRVKARLLEHGGQQLEDYQLLELLLFYTHPRGDVNPLAHRLIEAFGDLSGVLDASPEALRAIPGMGEHTTVLMKLVNKVKLS